MKRIFVLILAVALLAGLLAACGGNGGDDVTYPEDTQADVADEVAPPADPALDQNDAAETNDIVEPDEPGALEGDFVIGILQLFDHPALDASREGFIARMAELGLTEGDNVEFIVRNAQLDISVATQMAEFLVTQEPDLILSIATGASQAAARATEDNPIPVVFTAVTDPVTAELVESNERPGRNVTGVSDLTPVAMQIDLITRLIPDVQVVGLLYNAGEINSVIQANMAREAAESIGLQTVTGNVAAMGDIADVIQSLVGQIDVIYVPTCNTVAGAYPTVIMAADEAMIPVIVGESAGVHAGALATEGIDYYYLGRQTADMAARILRGDASPAEIPVEWQYGDGSLVINVASAERLGITIPQDLLDAAEIVEE